MYYEYLCTNEECKHEWEEEAGINDPKTEKCPKCQQQTAKRLISKTAFTLKGSGWASSGYGN